MCVDMVGMGAGVRGVMVGGWELCVEGLGILGVWWKVRSQPHSSRPGFSMQFLAARPGPKWHSLPPAWPILAQRDSSSVSPSHAAETAFSRARPG